MECMVFMTMGAMSNFYSRNLVSKFAPEGEQRSCGE